MIQQPEFLHWYEASLPPPERKKRGHFSTPARLVEEILDACSYTADKDLSRIRILDPACGGGNFLVEAARRLIDAGRRAGQSDRAIARQMQHNLWGFDPDPVSCFLADMQLHQCYNEQQLPVRSMPDFHIHQADGLAFPWQEEANIDLFLANPPYLAAKNTDLSGYLSTHRHGQSDSYLLFLDLALQIVRPGGWIALVLPDAVLARVNAAMQRQRLLRETTIHHLWHLADVFNAYVGAVVLIAQKCPPSQQHVITWKRERWPHKTARRTPARVPDLTSPKESQQILQVRLQQQPGAELRYLLSTINNTLVEQLQQVYVDHIRQCPPHEQAQPAFPLISLGEIVSIKRGEELGRESALIQTEPPSDDTRNWYPLLRGGIDLHPFHDPSANCWIHASDVTKPLHRYTQAKLLLVKSAGNLQATVDFKGHVVLQTLYILQLHAQTSNDSTRPARAHAGETEIAVTETTVEDELCFLMALLNSQLLRHYVYVLYTAYKLVQPQIEQHVLANLPIPYTISRTEKSRIIDHTRRLMNACRGSSGDVELQTQSKTLYEEQEQMITALYKRAILDASKAHAMPQTV